MNQPCTWYVQRLRDKAWALHRAQWLAGHCVVLHGPEPADIVSAPTWAEHNAYAAWA